MPNSDYDKTLGVVEHILGLPNDRQLAYAHNGPPRSRTVALFFSGLMGVGVARDVPKPCMDAGIHWITPSIPGHGQSSPTAPGVDFYVSFVRDVTALLDHLYPEDDEDGDEDHGFDDLYVAGGSYGAVHAQILYGAPYDLFPAGRKLRGCAVLAGFSPFRHHKNYTKDLTWQNWLSVGPPAYYTPFHLLQRLMAFALAPKLKTLQGTKKLLWNLLFSRMDEGERQLMAGYLEKVGRTEDDFIEGMARGAMRAYSNSWQGFYEVSDVLHADWGFAPAHLDDEHASKPIIIVGSAMDHLGGSTNGWMADNYKSATIKSVPGGHISALYFLDDLWAEVLKLCNHPNPAS